jgi:tagaturonate reductase
MSALDSSSETILQFGTGRFLRGFVDLFVEQTNAARKAGSQIVVLQSTGEDTADLFNRQAGRYHVAIRGVEDRQVVDRVHTVGSISRALAAARNWPAVLDLARSESLRAIVSNTTEAGFALDPADQAPGAPPRSFPAKLLSLLTERQRAGLPGLIILPCELLEGNGDRLRDLVLEQARRWQSPPSLVDWLGDACSWHNTLVDRIVSSPAPGDPLAAEDPLLAVAEPFAFWGMEGSPAVPELVSHPAVRMVDDLGPYQLRKVRILNGAHTALVTKARPMGFVTVRQAVADPRIAAWLESLLFDEIVPVLEGRTDDPAGFARRVLERFANPFLEHRLADIALHHDVKLRTRLMPTAEEYRAKFGRPGKLLQESLQPAQ